MSDPSHEEAPDETFLEHVGKDLSPKSFDNIELYTLFVAGVATAVAPIWAPAWYWSLLGAVVAALAVSTLRTRFEARELRNEVDRMRSQLGRLEASLDQVSSCTDGIRELILRPHLAEQAVATRRTSWGQSGKGRV